MERDGRTDGHKEEGRALRDEYTQCARVRFQVMTTDGQKAETGPMFNTV